MYSSVTDGPGAPRRCESLGFASGTRNHSAGVLRPCRAPGGDPEGGIPRDPRQSNFGISETIIINFETHVEYRRVNHGKYF